MKKVIMCDFADYNSPIFRLANYHYCNCFVKDGYEALWVSDAFNHMIYFKDKKDFYFKKSISSPQRHQLAERVYGFAPYSLWLYGNYPFCKDPKLLFRFEKYVIPNIRNSMEKMDFLSVDVLWISNPKACWLVNVVNYKKLVYRIADDYREFARFPNVAMIDKMMIKKADTVIISSSTLEQRVLEHGKTPLVLSNGVEFKHFSNRGIERPKDYQKQDRKRIVYVGALRHWFDTELIEKIAKQVDADIFLIGKCETDLSRLEKYDNVHILGARSYDLLPGYLQYADVALIPFIKTVLTDSVSPIKLYEYCSAGIAVVSTNLTETAKLNAPVWIAENHEAFIAGVSHYLTQGYDRSSLTEYGRRNSWDSRYERMKRICLG